MIGRAKTASYTVHLIYYWLDSVELAVERVRIRVATGGHNIPDAIVARRYFAGLKNFFWLYKELVDEWFFIDNSGTTPLLIAEAKGAELELHNIEKWNSINNLADDDT